MKDRISYLINFYKEKPEHLLPLIALIITIGVLFFGLPDEVRYAKDGFFRFFPLVVILGLIPWLIFKISKHHESAYGIVIAMASVLVFGPSYGVWSEKLKERDLDRYGEVTEGVIDKKWFAESEYGDDWMITCSFRYKGKLYFTFSQEDRYDEYEIGDTLQILFSKEFPENNRILGLD